jgi:c-di-GMP-related signal transduction protein
MEVYLGRQPILDRRWNVVGYELLFRSSKANFCDVMDDVAATSQVIVNAVLGVGLDRLLGGKQAFINFDRTLLLGDWSTLLTPDKVVIEILESVPPDHEVLAACHRIREQGYALALDDCPDDGRTAKFAPFVDILKVDFQQTSRADQENLVHRYRKLNIKMIAEKVETEAEFKRALEVGYDCFQGYFFARPTVVQAARIPASQISSLRLVKQIQREELDFHTIELLIRHEVSFSYSLLKYVNSAAFRWHDRIESVRQALALLGSDEIRKWVWMATLSTLGQHRPSVLMEQVLMRGRFCEAVASSANASFGDTDPFLLGMFSLLDAILQRPLQGILDDLNISQNIRNALLGIADRPDDPLSLVLRIVKAYEVCDWQSADVAARIMGLSSDTLNTCYLESLSWVETVFTPDESNGASSRFSAPVVLHTDNESRSAIHR